MDAATRPALSRDLDGATLLRWYWTLAELTGLARDLSVPTGGGKRALTARLAAALDGSPPPSPAPARRPSGAQLRDPVDRDTVIPAGQRSSQVLRAFFVKEIGPAFHFDGFMRQYLTDHAGQTLGDAVAHWHATREEAGRPREISPQFELNRFLRDWHQQHPTGGRGEALSAWREHRAAPRH